jgi:hypothetical protein
LGLFTLALQGVPLALSTVTGAPVSIVTAEPVGVLYLRSGRGAGHAARVLVVKITKA